jgi:hypothetical protein
MKMDADSFIYIIISIVILVLSGVGSARKKKAQKIKAPTGGGPGSPVPGLDAIDKIERMFTGRMEYENSDETEISDEANIYDEKPEPGDLFLNEEEQLKPHMVDNKKTPEFDSRDTKESEEEKEDQTQDLDELFSNIGEIKKAVIYSEIFTRKYT